MIEIYLTDNNPRAKLEKILNRMSGDYKIEVTENGKPYIAGNPVWISCSHSGNRGLAVISDVAVGADLEICRGRIRESVFMRFPERERAEIADERDFLYHWTARESYIKLYGLTLAQLWGRIEFSGEKISVDGQIQPVKLRRYDFWFGVGAVCTEE